MRTRVFSASFILAALIALSALPWQPICVTGNQAPRHRPVNTSWLVGFPLFPLFSDFDGDHKLDQAELVSRGQHQSIHLRFGDSQASALSFDVETAVPGRLVSVDIDRDDDLDLIWLPLSSQRAVVWLGDGKGHFELATNSEIYAPAVSLLINAESGPRLAKSESDISLLYFPAPSAPLDLVLAKALAPEALLSLTSTSHDQRRGLALCLAYLRERGPPSAHL
jgi:hypothetical protein